MAHGAAREGKWRGNWRMEWVASTLHTTSEHDVSSISTADAHTSAASSRLNWRPRRFKWTRPGFCACAITFQLASTKFYHSAWCVPNGLVSQIKEGRDVVWTRSNRTSKAVKLHLSVPLHFSLRLSVKAVTSRAEELSRDLRCIYIHVGLSEGSGSSCGWTNWELTSAGVNSFHFAVLSIVEVLLDCAYSCSPVSVAVMCVSL